MRLISAALLCAALCSCQKVPEMTLEEIAEAREKSSRDFFTATKSKPYKGQEFVPGLVGGEWNDVCMADPKTFNYLVAERDGQSAGIMAQTSDWLFDYDYQKREWVPNCAFFEIEADESRDILTVHVRLRDGLYWSYINSDKKIPVTSDDIVWWYDEVSGDERFQSSAYSGQFVTMPDGSVSRIKAVRVDDKNFDFVFPRIVADPLLATNDSFKPCWLYKKAKEEGGVEGVKNLFGIDSDVKSLPSMGMWFIESYSPGQRLVFARNENYWKKDSREVSVPYPQKMTMQIVGDQNTSYLLFTQGKMETYSPNPENLDDVIRNQADDYTVFNADGSLGAQLWSFNQNPKNRAEPFYEWFCKKEFRQAMSCLLNRDRIIAQTYRGLAYPKYDFFPNGNPFYNPDIQLEYKFDAAKAEALLKKIGFERASDGRMRDHKKRPVEFDLTIA
ncbi:MAG: ABC transporter substrate-binding protein, partial [Treponema sp.]|nr:ABC transporter substrate-binding protein [Treponema sp.]